MVYREIRVSDAGVVDDDFKAAEFKPDSAEEPIDGVRIANVAGVNKYVRGLHFLAGPLEFGFAASREDEVGAFLAQRLGDGQANAPRGAGDERSLSFKGLRLSAGQGRTSYRVTANFSNGKVTRTHVPEWFESTFKVPPN